MEPLKERLRQLMAMRDAMEGEINERLARLEGPGGPGRTGSLVDAEGFPRTDIDVYAVREDRHRVAVLTNDHRAITDEIQETLLKLHAEARDTMEVDAAAGIASVPSTSSEGVYYPFAYVDSVSPDSPASAAGIECGDQLCQFGRIVGRASKNDGILTRLAAVLKAETKRSCGMWKAVETVFLRNGEVRRLQLTPRKWGGPGLIGCHLRPMAS